MWLGEANYNYMTKQFFEKFGSDELTQFLNRVMPYEPNIYADSLNGWHLVINIPIEEYNEIEPYSQVKGLSLVYYPEDDKISTYLTFDLQKPHAGLLNYSFRLTDSIEKIIEESTIGAKTCLHCNKQFNLNQIYVYLTGHCCIDCARQFYPIPKDWKPHNTEK